MRVLMITDFYWPYEGGVEQHVRRLSGGLTSRGNEVAVVTLGGNGLVDFEWDGQVRVYRVHSFTQHAAWLFSHSQRPWAPPFPDPGVTRAIRKILTEEQPEIVHGHDWLARSFLPLRTGSHARFVMSLHYYTISCAKKSLFAGSSPCSGPGVVKCLRCASNHYGLGKGIPVTLGNWWWGAAERAAVDMFLPVSQATAEENGLTDRDRYQVVPNFMPEHRVSPRKVRVFLEQLPQEPFLMFVGDLRRAKGIDILLSAYQDLLDAPPLVLIGKTWEDTPEIFPDKVILLRNWPNEAVLAAWKRCLIGIVPSVWPEPFGIVVIEAMASGRPVIASRIGGIPDIIQDGINGLLVTPGDPVALRQAIQQLLADQALRNRLGHNARRRAAAFQAEAVVPSIEHIYQELLASQPEKNEPTASGERYYQQL